jgi:hypothetical protein
MTSPLKTGNGGRATVVVVAFALLVVGMLVLALVYPWGDEGRIATEGLQAPPAQQETTGEHPPEPSPGGVPLPPYTQNPPPR